MNKLRPEISEINQDLIQKWIQELNDHGFIQNEGEILEHLKVMDLSEGKNRIAAAQTLTIIALSAAARGKQDSLVLAWMEKANELDPNNQDASDYLACFEWKDSRKLLDEIKFPPIRETDNRQAKKQTVDIYIMICSNFLKTADDHIAKLSSLTNSPCQITTGDTTLFYQSIIRLLEEAREEITSLLKVTSEYKNSLIGSFHTALYLDEMKTHLTKIEELKVEWKKTFSKLEDQSEEKAEDDSTHALEELNNMIGLQTVKNRLNDFYQFFNYQKQRKEKGFQTKDEVSLNMILTGNPGTGKTTLARLFAKIYYELGVLPSEEVVETNRSQLVGSFVGQTEENVRSVVEKSLGGVLFIDEAYSLKRNGQSGNDYGQTAIDTLVSLMTGHEYGGKFAVILAGYPDEMRQFLEANPGLRSRFPMSNYISLPDYSNEELIAIGEQLASDNDYILTSGAKIALEERIEKERVDHSFGNARTVRNIVLDAIFRKGSTLDFKAGADILSFSLLEEKDFSLHFDENKEHPQQKLDQLIGLSNVKEEVRSIISFVKMQKIRRDFGLPVVPIQLHSVFTGNPGTGKTTVAKIYAELLKECGLLKRGHLMVTSRADFVAGYVGQTAIKTRRKIREALGGVLFIDEAYSLLGQSSGDFGKEVIDTLVDEMTKHNENLVVVLAGYPNEMQMLLDSNPGLQSRFKKFIHFEDYSNEELLQIMKVYGNGFQLHLTQKAEEYLLQQLKNTSRDGNGRFATNLLDESIQAQALRIMSEPSFVQNIEKTSIIEKEDIEKALVKLRGENSDVSYY